MSALGASQNQRKRKGKEQPAKQQRLEVVIMLRNKTEAMTILKALHHLIKKQNETENRKLVETTQTKATTKTRQRVRNRIIISM